MTRNGFGSGVLVVIGLFLLMPMVSFGGVPTNLLGIWDEKPAVPGQDIDRIGFSAEGYYFHEITREVGQYGTHIPYPTVCRHFEEGRIEYLGPASKSTIDRYTRSRREAPTHTLVVRIERVELIPAKDNGNYCPDWLLDAQARVARGESEYEWNFSLIKQGRLFDPWREIDFVRLKR